MREYPIAIFECKDEVWYMTRPLWNRIWHTKHCIRVLFTRATNEEMDWIDEINMVNPDKCANMLRDILNKNPFTYYMN
jgi:hypothetical protein